MRKQKHLMEGNMIFYFSGTGNSKWAAEELARMTHDTAKELAPLLLKGEKITLSEGERLGIVFPIYAWAVPKPVREFLSLVEADGYRYAVCTCGDEAGYAIRNLQKTFPLHAAWSLKMPNNYIPMADVDPVDAAKAKVEAAKPRLASAAEAVLVEKSVFDIAVGSFPGLKSGCIAPMFERHAMDDKPFFAEDTCTSCGLCERVCPVKNIVLKDGKPAWQGSCTQCLACIHRCPAAAIQYGKGTKKRGRYYFGKDF